MTIGQLFDRGYWRLFSVTTRLRGLGFLPAGLVVLGWAAWLLVHPTAAVTIDGVPTRHVAAKLGVLAFSLPFLLLGAYMLRRRPYRPDLGDSLWLVDPMAAKFEPRTPRRWWTGDPVERNGGPDVPAA